MVLIIIALCLCVMAIDDVTLPIDFRTVTPGKPSYIADNDEELRDNVNSGWDTLTQTRAPFTNWVTDLTMTSQQNLIMKLDEDTNATEMFFIQSGEGDSP